jgi:ribosomal protein S18 acetylase RimI-like enzyme
MAGIRLASEWDAEALPAIERSAAEAFRQLPELAWIADDTIQSVERHRELIAQRTSWVAVDDLERPLGFLSAEVLGRELHIWELSVHRDHQRRGLGKALVETAIDHARRRQLVAVTLTTFRDVIWNERFYRRLDFQTLAPEEAGKRLNDILVCEAERGLPRERRCAMRLGIEQC